ncbi:MAG: sulfatase [Chloroflexi bacterium AL-W]|nr:sulfatase [Chloroflexi bacterium AL-N1]NOK69455.1 sulfatase [Chloroflexi bacterium AL-N10]NOK77420.1 sulfatase [Chloroflexi bacterium AL-N5]NOK84271.1 sulfatase [Chloroflexi bacterium AL-W]NOK91564.1 sulfatase [Chloroflexi bacterium AL-N15]
MHAGAPRVYDRASQIPVSGMGPIEPFDDSRVSSLTQTIDVMPTFLDFHGCVLPPHVQGHSLWRAMNGETLRRDGIFGYLVWR